MKNRERLTSSCPDPVWLYNQRDYGLSCHQRKKIPHCEKLVELLQKIEGMTSITISVNQKNTNVIMGDSYEVLWGQAFITDYIGEIKYQISPLSFSRSIRCRQRNCTDLHWSMQT